MVLDLRTAGPPPGILSSNRPGIPKIPGDHRLEFQPERAAHESAGQRAAVSTVEADQRAYLARQRAALAWGPAGSAQASAARADPGRGPVAQQAREHLAQAE